MAALRKGAKGGEVRKLQEGINKALRETPKLKLDGDFGPKTDAALRRFQKKAGMSADGIAGNEVKAMIKLFIVGVKWPHGDIARLHKDREKELDDGVRASEKVEENFDEAGTLCEEAAETLAYAWDRLEKSIDRMIEGYVRHVKTLEQLKTVESEFNACARRNDVLRQKTLVAEAAKLKKKAEDQYSAIDAALTDAARKEWNKAEKALKAIGKFQLSV
ncbi:hypothetical protein LNKW23_28970 [Paralimibaculum aggregatum]|uniref:Peptidoglycan binding-like domain-containing protein n=1 Tax=Paralimibaculum aggregatum TaxID=3036245 RepID=A0ABQ6LR51_9RHOB|nr:peptidoglycan-binding domain-containing protein [Limibaculum sp. NKW23]GMG83684.1 hypothetical protein LNKW23_28970 [Limibaculum sp. NKW23]